MSADLEIAGGLILLPIAVAALPIIGVGYAIYKGAGAIQRHNERERQRRIEEQRIQEQLQAKRNESNYAKMISIRSEYQGVVSDYEATMLEIEDEFSRKMSEYSQSLELNAKYVKNEEFKNFEEKAEQKRKRLLDDFKLQRERLYTEFSVQIKSAFDNISQSISNTRNEMETFRQVLAYDPRKEQMAREMLENAKAIVLLCKIESADSVFVLEDELNSAVRYYDSGDFEMSYSKASSVAMECLKKLEQTKILQREFHSLIDEISDLLFTNSERLAKARTANIPFNGELKEENLTRFEPELFLGLENQRKALKQNLDELLCFNRNNISSLRILLSECSELDQDILNVSKYALAKCIFAFSENNEAEVVTEALEEQGFQMLDYAYESEHEGNVMHVNFQNPISNERVTVVFTPTEHGVQVMVHNFGSDSEYSGNASTQRAIQTAIESKLGRKGRCSGLGGKSTNVSASDLNTVKSSQSTNSNSARRLADTM